MKHISFFAITFILISSQLAHAVDLSHLNAQKSDLCERALGVKNTMHFLNENGNEDFENNKYQPGVDMLEFYNLYFKDDSVAKKNCAVKDINGVLQKFSIGQVIYDFAANPYWLKKADEHRVSLTNLKDQQNGEDKEAPDNRYESKPVYELYQCGLCTDKSTERQNIIFKTQKLYKYYVTEEKLKQYVPYTFLDFSTTCQFYGFIKPTTHYVTPKNIKTEKEKKSQNKSVR